ncbi:hypothetical protein QP938_08675 [Porticoccaceae bacterium LTM1]|nr:hypothetical protein QP938_08675 [Porticoccaceae bacterium LTM1]
MAAEKRLYDLPRFWLAILIPIFLWLLTSIVIWANDGQWWAWKWDSEGYKNYWEMYKLPLAMLALIFPAVGLAAATHRSEQMATNISLQRSQNTLSNYYQHRREFCEYISVFESEDGFDKSKISPLCKLDSYIVFPSPVSDEMKYRYKVFDNLNSGLGIKAHGLLFPGALEGDLILDEKLMLELTAEWTEVKEWIHHVIKGRWDYVSEQMRLNELYDSVCSRMDMFLVKPDTWLGMLSNIEFTFQYLGYAANFHSPQRFFSLMSEEDLKKFPFQEVVNP